MNQNTNEEPVSLAPDDTSEAPTPARKRAAAKKTTAKKATAKKTATKKTTAKKTTAKKTAAKKTVRKAAKKIATAAAADTPELPFASVPAESPPSPPVAEERPAAPTPAPVAPLSPAADPASPPAEEISPRRFGRVPGGGPVSPRGSTEQPPAVSQESSSLEQAPSSSSDEPQTLRISRSKKRREKRKRSKEKSQERQQHNTRQPHKTNPEDRRNARLSGPEYKGDGVLELTPKGFGFLRVPHKKFDQSRDDVFVPPEIIRKYNLRHAQWVHGLYQHGPRGSQLVNVTRINGLAPEEAAKLPHFDELKAINPTRRISFETAPERYTTRVIDIMAPIGRGQRGIIASPPRSGKTTLLLHMAEAVREKYEEQIHLMVLLVDERPEEVTEFRRALPGVEIYASSNDEHARNHCRIAELAIERAKRLVEAGKDVFLLMDSITRLARAYNNNMGQYNANAKGKGNYRSNRATGTGGVMIGALEVPRRLFAAARNTRGGGSLTIIATALIQTNSRADEAIFMEFKGTGNMELVLDRKIAENYIYPAVDIFKSGTRREELLLPEHMLHKIHLIRRGLSGHRPTEAMERLLFFQKKFPNNPQMLLEIKG